MSDETTIRDVLAWSERVGRYIVDHRFHAQSREAEEVLDTLNRLTELARKGLSAPLTDDVRWAIRNDPVAYAAYSYGRQAALLPEQPPSHPRRQDMETREPDAETFVCDSCGADCPGTSECNSCGRTLCLDCEGEYDNACAACYDEDTD